MLKNEILQIIEDIQEKLVGQSVPRVYNEQVYERLEDEHRESLKRALDVLGSETEHPLHKSQALAYIAVFSKQSHDLEIFNDVVNKWLNDDTFMAGVNKDGSIVLWDVEQPESRISTKPVEF